MFSQLSSNKLRLHTVTRLFWRNSAICNFTKKSDRQQSTSSIKGYTVFLSSFVSLFFQRKERDRRKETHNLVVIKVIGCCVLLVWCFLLNLFLLSTRNKKGESKRKHHTNKHSCTSPTLDFIESQAAFVLHCSERAYHSFFTFAPRCW